MSVKRVELPQTKGVQEQDDGEQACREYFRVIFEVNYPRQTTGTRISLAVGLNVLTHHSSQLNSPCELQHGITESASHDLRTRNQWLLYFLTLLEYYEFTSIRKCAWMANFGSLNPVLLYSTRLRLCLCLKVSLRLCSETVRRHTHNQHTESCTSTTSDSTDASSEPQSLCDLSSKIPQSGRPMIIMTGPRNIVGNHRKARPVH